MHNQKYIGIVVAVVVGTAAAGESVAPPNGPTSTTPWQSDGPLDLPPPLWTRCVSSDCPIHRILLVVDVVVAARDNADAGDELSPPPR